MTKVYVTQITAHDLTQAASYGEIEIMLKQARDQTFAPQPVFRQLKNCLKDFTDNDYLLLIGDPIAMALAVNAAGQANNGRVKLLKWSKKHEQYYPVEVDLHDRAPGNLFNN